MVVSSLWQRAHASGQCPPSLLGTEEMVVDDDGFAENVLKVVVEEEKGFFLLPDVPVASEFAKLLEKVNSIDKVSGAAEPGIKQKTLDYRRCVLLAIVGATPTESPSLDRILSNGYLLTVKSWLEEALSSSEGGVDMLLHLLSNIASLPVTKSVVKDSGMGKAIGSIEKHSKCKDTPNESAIKERVQRVKDEWQASVKARKVKTKPKDETVASPKRPLELSISASSPTVKRTKTGSSTTAFSSLLKKVSKPTATKTNAAKSDTGDKKPLPKAETQSSSTAKSNGTANEQSNGEPDNNEPSVKKAAKRVKWADHFGGPIHVSQNGEGEAVDHGSSETSVSWSDRKKRDRLREKELLAKAKKSKLLDDDDLDLDLPKPIQPVVEWRTPSLLPDRPDATKPQLESSEMSAQDERVKTVPKAVYSFDYDVPTSPAPLSDVEQALDMTSQAAAVAASIPFFVPAQPVVEAPAPAYQEAAPVQPSHLGSSVFQAQPSSVATPEFVQSLGLPMFLVGQPVQALQTLASSPGLLSTLVDANGMYDQHRLMSLVQTLSSSSGLQPQPSLATSYPPVQNAYGAPAPAASYGQQPPPFNPSAPRGGAGSRGKSDEGNLHVGGFGPSTTEAEIISAFSPYVQVDEVVMKGTFAFVNTSDPVNAMRAKESLHGTLIGGMPIRINNATRKNRDSSLSHYGNGAPDSRPSFPRQAPGGFGAQAPPVVPSAALSGMPPSAPGMPPMPPANIPNVESVRDDRGNPATKNLFIAGYGQGTTEQQLRDLVSQFANVTGVVTKGSFSFVNTTDRNAAVLAREMLGGTMFNGGVLRINFAKETGRLGTSFDLTYNVNTGPRARGAGPPPQAMNYYGRGGGGF